MKNLFALVFSMPRSVLALLRGRFALVSYVFCFLFLLTSYFILHTSYFGNAHAQSACSAPGSISSQEAVDQFNKCAIEKDIFDDKIFNFNQMAGTSDSLYTLLLGESQLHPETNAATRGGGALAASGKIVAALYATPPASGVSYFAHEIRKFNPVQPAYAQTGIGYDSLQPVQEIWKIFRNISYVGFVIVFVIMGFMIMFRAHISPQAVATVQDSIPRIVVALILVTFSYAIAGLMIDVMYLFLNIVINALASQGLVSNEANSTIFQKSIFGVVWDGWKDTFSSVSRAIGSIITETVDAPLGLGKLIGWFGGTIAALVIGIALLFIMFRIFFMLLVAYAMIIILTMAAPFFFLIQALPGNNGAKEWFKQMAANIAVFPAVAMMIVFAGVLGDIGSYGGINTFRGGAATPIGESQLGGFPLLAGGLDVAALGGLIAIGLLLMTPEAANMVKNFIGVKGGPNMGAAGAALGGAAGALYTGSLARSGVNTARGAWGRATQESQEALGARIPFISGALKEKRRALGIRQTAGTTGTSGPEPEVGRGH